MGKAGLVTIKAVGDFGNVKKQLKDTGAAAAEAEAKLKKASGTTGDFGKAFGKTQTSLGSFAGKMAGAFVGVAVGVAVIKRATGFIVECAKAAQEDADRFTALQQVMQNQGQATEPLIRSMKEYIDQTRLATGASEEELVPALARLQAATKDTAKTQDLANVAMDVAVARHLDLTAVSTALAKAQQGTLTSLQRLGVAVKDSSGKALTFDQILTNLKGTYGGAAAAVANVDPWKRLAQAWDILKESIGENIIPAINKILPQISRFVGEMSEAIRAGDWSKLGSIIGDVVGKGIAGAVKVLPPMAIKIIPQIVGGLIAGAGATGNSFIAGLQDWLKGQFGAERTIVQEVQLLGSETGKNYSDAIATEIARGTGLISNASALSIRAGIAAGQDISSKAFGDWVNNKLGLAGLATLQTAADKMGYAFASELAVAIGSGQMSVQDAMDKLNAATHPATEAIVELSDAATAGGTAFDQSAASIKAYAYYTDMVTKAQDLAAASMERITGFQEALQTAAQRMDIGKAWDDAKGKLKSYHKAVKDLLATYAKDAAALGKLQIKFPSVPGSVWKKVADMPGFAEALAAEGASAANTDVWNMIKILAAGGDTAAQAYIDSFGTPEVTGTVKTVVPPKTVTTAVSSMKNMWGTPYVPVKVTPTGLTSTWADIKAFFAGKHITIDTNLGGYGSAKGYAAGGIVTSRQDNVSVAEEGPEAIIPLTKPRRAAQVMAQAGLSGSSDMSTVEALLVDVINAIRALPERQKAALRTA